MAEFLPYAHCYCEENTYICLEKVREYPELFDRSFAVFMSSFQCTPSLQRVNSWTSTVPYRSFKATDPRVDLVVWDYHVIAVVRCKSNGRWYVIDRDSGLPHANDFALENWKVYCIGLELYCTKTLFLERSIAAPYGEQIRKLLEAVRFRVIVGSVYLCCFRSDRSHMMDDGGNYSQEPPPWRPIQDFPPWARTAEREEVKEFLTSKNGPFLRNNLSCFINMVDAAAPGTVIDRDAFTTFFS